MINKFPQKSASTEYLNKSFNDKRKLTWIPLAPPDYIIDPILLVDSFIERECVFLGTLNNISTVIDLKKRNEVLKIIDNGHIGQKLGLSNVESILSISAQNIKLNMRVFPETFILRIPVEQIISVAYVRDNALHYITILHHSAMTMESRDGSLTVIKVESHIKSEEICSLITQCFQILYTEATLRQFDRQLHSIISYSELEFPYQENKVVKNELKSVNLEEMNFNDIESVYSDLSASKAELLQNFMVRLQQVLNADEMKQFACSLSAWQRGSPFESFCRKTKDLLGPTRLTLLADMQFFIDPADRFTLEQFLTDFNSPVKSRSSHGHWSQLLAKCPLPIQMQRSISYASTSNGVLSIYDEENSLKDDLSSPMKSSYYGKPLSTCDIDDEFAKNIDNLFQKVGDLDLILSSDK